MHSPDLSLPVGHIFSSAGAPLVPGGIGNIFVMDLHAADSLAGAGWQVDGTGRLLRNVNTTNHNFGVSFVGSSNILDSGREHNSSHGVLVTGNGNRLENVDAINNGGDGVRVIGATTC